MHIVQRGAEAVLYSDRHEGKQVLVKERIKKGYRTPELDKLIRTGRTKREENLLRRARRAGVLTPNILDVTEFIIVMEYIKGKTVKDVLNTLPKNKKSVVYKLIGDAVARLHSAGIIHGDLTTSNMVLSGSERLIRTGKAPLYLIDFGLGKFSRKIEDQAIDLYLLYEALRSTHFKFLDEAWGSILKIYKQKYSMAKSVIGRIEEIKKRRRYARGKERN